MIPKEVVFGDYRVKVITGNRTDVELADAGCQADSDTNAGVIRVRTDIHPALQREAFVHEVIHHAWSLTGLPALLDEHEEVVVRSLAPWLTLALMPQGDR